MERTETDPRRAAIVFVSLAIGAVSVLCTVFLLGGRTLPDWIVLAGRWIPALASLAVMRMLPLPGGLSTWWTLRPGGRRRLVTGAVVEVGVLFAAYALPALIAGATGLATPLSWPELAPILLLLVPIVAVYSLSTFGEEVAWRGYLQRLLAGWGFWPSSTVVAGVWVLFHVPLHGTLALQGTLPTHALVGSTLLLFPLGLFLSAAVHRFGSVWPAVFAHALPMSALNLVQNPGGLLPGSFWAFTTLSAAALLGAAFLLAPRRTRTAPRPLVAGAG